MFFTCAFKSLGSVNEIDAFIQQGCNKLHKSHIKHVTKDFYNAPFTRGVCVNAWRRACLKLGADTTVIVTTANHITFLVVHEWDWLASALGYLHKAIWLADVCVVENVQLLPRATPVKQRDEFHSATLDVTPVKVNERCWCRRPCSFKNVINQRIIKCIMVSTRIITTWSHKNTYLCALSVRHCFTYLTGRYAAVSKRNIHWVALKHRLNTWTLARFIT